MAWANPLTLKRRGVLGMNSRNIDYIGRYNDRRNYPLVDNKLETKLVVRKAGVTVPELLGVVRTQHEIELINDVLEPFHEFVIKPAQGSGGRGILVIVGRADDGFRKSNGDVLSLRDVKRHLSNILSGLHSLGGRTDVAIIEDLVISDDTFAHLSHEGVPDIRLIVFRGYPVMGMLRLATKASDGKANLHQGAVGVGLDIGTGRNIAAVQYDRPISHHPDTGAPLDDIVVPHWRELLTLASLCCDVTHLGYLGADLVLDQRRGPLLLELNARPGLTIQIANSEGLVPRLSRVDLLEEHSRDPGVRVEFAMQHFAHEPYRPQRSLWESAAPSDTQRDTQKATKDTSTQGSTS
jgi:alpha-L-glutamate ligase-like protein